MSGDLSQWPQIVSSGISTLIGAFIAGYVALRVSKRNHEYSEAREEKAAAVKLQNEKQASEDKLRRERYFIATELVLMLEFFAAECADVAVSGVDMQGGLQPGVSALSPQLIFDGTEGDWRAVPDALLYRIRELPVLCANAEALIRNISEQTEDVRYTFECRQYQYARIGLFALFAASRLRRKCGLPSPRPGTDSRTVFSILWRWRRHLWRRSLKSLTLSDDI